MIFISHDMDDREEFQNIVDELADRGIPYFDPEKMLPGGVLSDMLRQAISQSVGCIFIATRKSLDSKWCFAELGAFWGAGKPVSVYLADAGVSGEELPPQLRSSLLGRRLKRIADSAEAWLGKAAEESDLWFSGEWSAFYYYGREADAVTAGTIGTLTVANVRDPISMTMAINRSKAGNAIDFRFQYKGELCNPTQVVTTFASTSPKGLPMYGAMTFSLHPATQKMLGCATYVDRQGQLVTDCFLFRRPDIAAIPET